MRRELLSKVTAGQRLTQDEALEAGRDLAAGQTEPLVAAAFLAALAARGETAEEVSGLALAFREALAPFAPFPEAVDTCGTGGDGRKTFNLSTAAAITVAALGLPVAKHGNRSVSSACGSADLLERAGYPIEESAGEGRRRLEERGFAFLFAPRYHPAMAFVAPIRKALGVRTVFNLLGPLLNPAGVRRQVLGVFDEGRLGLVADALQALGTQRALVVHGSGGYDEAILHGPVKVLEVNGTRQEYEVTAGDFGLPWGRPEDLDGGTPEQNLRTLLDLLAGEASAGLRAAVSANAALALRAGGVQEDLREGAGRAMEALRTGAVGRYFERLITLEEDARAQVS